MSIYAQRTKALVFAVLLAIAVTLGFAVAPQGHAYAAEEGSQLNAASLGAQDGGDSSTAVALKDGVYKLPNLKAGPSEMFNHFVEDSTILEVSGDTATIKFVTDGSTSSIQKYSKIALGNSADLVQEPYQSELAEGTVIIGGVKQAAEEAEQTHAAQLAELQERIDWLEGELQEANERLTVERKRAADADAERKAWIAEREAMTAQMNAITEKLLEG